MAPTAADVDRAVSDLSDQYCQLSREYAATADEERKAELSDILSFMEYQMARLRGLRSELLQQPWAQGAG